MSNLGLLLVLTGLVIFSGVFLTMSWHKYIMRHHQKKQKDKLKSF